MERLRPPGLRVRPQPKQPAERTWTPKLGKRFTQISRTFLDNFHQLPVVPVRGKKKRGMNTTEAMAVILLISHKWSESSPFPSMRSISERLGIDIRSAREVMKNLETAGYLQREQREYTRTNLFHLDGLFRALEAIQDLAVEANDEEEEEDE